MIEEIRVYWCKRVKFLCRDEELVARNNPLEELRHIPEHRLGNPDVVPVGREDVMERYVIVFRVEFAPGIFQKILAAASELSHSYYG